MAPLLQSIVGMPRGLPSPGRSPPPPLFLQRSEEREGDRRLNLEHGVMLRRKDIEDEKRKVSSRG